MENTLMEELNVSEVNETTEDNKGVAAFTLVLFLSGLTAGFCLLLYKGPQMRMVQVSGFLIMGILFAILVRKKRATLDFTDRLIYVLVITVFLHLLLGLAGFFLKSFHLFFYLSFVATFLLPYIVWESWKTFLSLPKLEPVVWHYSSEQPPVLPLFDEVKMPLRIAVKKSFMKPRILFTTLPVEARLDTAFYLTIIEQYDKLNATANFMNEEGKAYNWVFYKTQWFFWKRYLHPENTLYENGIKPNSIITAERLVFENT